jgi:putative IMPACT (imprinted ancient) family translation regulator
VNPKLDIRRHNARLHTFNTKIYQQVTLTDINHHEDDIISSFYIAEEIEKKSRFIGLAKHVTSWSQAQLAIAQIREIHPKARHVCYGFIAGTIPVQERSSDDGEPTGTAGQPILGL